MLLLGLAIGITLGGLGGATLTGLACHAQIDELEQRVRQGAARLRVDLYQGEKFTGKTMFLGGRYVDRAVTVTAWEVLDVLKHAAHLEASGRNFSRREIVGTRLLSRGQYEALRAELHARGFLTPGSDGAPTHWTAGGRALLRAVSGAAYVETTMLGIPAPALFTTGQPVGSAGGQRATGQRAGRG